MKSLLSIFLIFSFFLSAQVGSETSHQNEYHEIGESLDEIQEGIRSRSTRDTIIKKDKNGLQYTGILDMPWRKGVIDYATYDVPTRNVNQDENSNPYIWVIIGSILLGLLVFMVILVQVSKYNATSSESGTKSHSIGNPVPKVKSEKVFPKLP